MILRPLLALAVALLAGCPSPVPGVDAGEAPFSPGNPSPAAACSGGCAANQLCDAARRICVDACGGCTTGSCAQVGPNQFQCVVPSTSCNGAACAPGQVACLGGACSCLSSSQGGQDTCAVAGKWCNGAACGNPTTYQQCRVGGAPCPAMHLCTGGLFGDDTPVCLVDCGRGGLCARGDICGGFSGNQAGCLGAAFFAGQGCFQNLPEADGGWVTLSDGGAPLRQVPVSHTCLLLDHDGLRAEPMGRGTGTCRYQLYKFWDRTTYALETCVPPGLALEGQPCRADLSVGGEAAQCATGLECAVLRGSGQGLCLRTCNANPPRPGLVPQPACGAQEACVNLYRLTDPSDNAVLGVCLRACDVFDGGASTCPAVGAVPTSCVPATADGQLLLSLGGEGLCVPRQTSVAATGQRCAEADPFKGATCGDAELCLAADVDTPATCAHACDLPCSPADGGTGPASCATEPNARCPAGQACQRVTSTTGARVGLCR